MHFDMLTIIFTVAALLIIIVSPILFRKNVYLENGRELSGWVHLFSSKWFGATFVFLLLFGNYSEFTLFFVVNKLAVTLVLSFFTSLLANYKLLLGKKMSIEKIPTKNARL